MRVGRVVVLAVPWAWLTAFLLAPCAIVLAIALAESVDAIPPFSLAHPGLDNFVLIATDPLYSAALLLSLKVAGVSTAICLLAGYPMALAIARSPERWRSLLLLLVMLPFWTGFLMRINAWIGLLQDDGWINAVMVALGLAPLRLLYTDSAMYIGIVYTYLPFMVLPLYARLSRLDERLLDAAADLGAAPWRVFLSVTLPLSMPGVWAGMLLVFIPAVGEYVIPELLGGPQAQLIGRVLWEEFFQNRDWPTAAAIACALLVLLLLLPAAVVWVIGRSPLPPPLVRFTAQAHKGRGSVVQAVTSVPPGAAAPSVATGHRQEIRQARDETTSRLHP
jgi:putrescine transport system permease protein